jgi:protein-export membrane protein SecD
VTSEGNDIVVQLSEAEKQATDERTMQQSLEIIRRRVDEAGTREPTIQRQGTDRILIQVPGHRLGGRAEKADRPDRQADLQRRRQPYHRRGRHCGSAQPAAALAGRSGIYYIIEESPVVSGDELVDSQPSFDQNGAPAVSFRFDTTGARKFGDYTANNIGQPFAIVLDNQVISAPVIQSHIPGGSGIITGSFTVEDSTRLAVLCAQGRCPPK